MTAKARELRLSDTFALPLDAVTETFGILAKRGSGKTYAAGVLVEEMLGAGLPVVVVDPLGVWWGLRASADGKGPGEPVVIFGGDHADVPLADTSGELLADVVVAERIPAVLDLSGLSKAGARRFMTDFAERLYRLNRDPLHLVVDEADAFAPQRAQHGTERLLGAMEDLVRRGRARGIGVTMITQRPAVLNKDVLTQIEALIVLRMTGPRDVAAIDEWVRLHADEDEAREVKASLPSLPIGTAWLWSPGWLGVLARIKIRTKRTFDSSATPKMGEARPAPRGMAPVDLAALGARIEATIERAKIDDPKQMRVRIRELEAAAARRPEPVVERVEVPVLAEADIDRLQLAITDWADRLGPAIAIADELLEQITKLRAGTSLPAAAKVGGASQRRSSAAAQSPSPGVRLTPGTANHEEKPAGVVRETRPGAPAGLDDDRRLAKAERAALTVLAQHGTRTKTQIAILTGYAHNGGGFNNALSSLRSAGYIEGRDPISATEEGLAALGPYVPLPTGPALIAHWHSRLGKAERLVLDALVDAWPESLDKDTLAETTGYVATGGGFNNALGKLRSLELIEGRNDLRATEALVEP